MRLQQEPTSVPRGVLACDEDEDTPQTADTTNAEWSPSVTLNQSQARHRAVYTADNESARMDTGGEDDMAMQVNMYTPSEFQESPNDIRDQLVLFLKQKRLCAALDTRACCLFLRGCGSKTQSEVDGRRLIIELSRATLGHKCARTFCLLSSSSTMAYGTCQLETRSTSCAVAGELC